MDELLQQGANSLVFDLRDNTGENLNAALVAADYCVPSGEIAKQQDRDGNVTVLRMSDETEINVPIVCLVNGSTAGSASCSPMPCARWPVRRSSAPKLRVRASL